MPEKVPNKIRLSIKWKLMIVMTILMACLVVTLTLVQIEAQKRMLEKDLVLRIDLKKENLVKLGKNLIANLAYEVENYIAVMNYSKAIDAIEDRVEKNREIKYARLRYAFVELVIPEKADPGASESKKMWAVNDSEEPMIREYLENGKPVIEIACLLQISTEPLGVLKLIYDLDHLDREIELSKIQIQKDIKKIVYRSIWTSGTFMAACIVIVYLLATRLSNPLIHLTESANKLSKGDFDVSSESLPGTSDEVGLLAKAFIEMSRELKISYGEIEASKIKLEEYSKTLEMKVAERTKELDRKNATLSNALREVDTARKDAEAANRAKSVFLANMSHEIRTPMNAVIGMTNLAMRNDLPQKAREQLKTVQQSAHSLLSLINDILDFSKIEAGRLDLEFVTFSLRKTIENLSNMFSMKAAEKDLKLTFTIDKKLPDSLIGDHMRVNQVLTNLVNNAVKFTNHGNISVRVRNEEPEKDGKALVGFYVSDTGIGIPWEILPEIFNPFTQTDASFTRKYGGTGLGLSICKRLVELMGGKILVESAPGLGSEFRFAVEFEIAPTEKITEACEAMGNENTSFQGRKILLVEDNEINQLVATEILENAGISVDIAKDGIEAVKAVIEEGLYDAVLMDIQMPRMDGFEATAKIRGFENNKKSIPIIAMTAHAMKGDRSKCIAAGMDDYVSKPIDTDKLFAVLGRCIDTEKNNHAGYRKSEPRQTNSKPPSNNLPGLNIASALKRLNGNGKLYAKLLQDFAEKYFDVPGRIGDAIEKYDFNSARRLAHDIKGMAGNLSADRLFQAAADFYKEVEETDERGRNKMLKELNDAMGEVLKSSAIAVNFFSGAK